MDKYYKLLDRVANKDILINYFILFSRAEYALKRAGYINSDASANWDKYFSAYKNSIASDIKNTSHKINSSFQHLLTRPPKKQSLENGNLKWEDLKFSSDVNCINVSIRAVRNNLFHGGKYPDGPIDDYESNTELLTSCINIILYLFELDRKVYDFVYNS